MTESKLKPASDGNNVLSDFQKRAIENGRAQNQSEQNENGSTSELEEVQLHTQKFFLKYMKRHLRRLNHRLIMFNCL